jgi:hypothetical protein
MNGPSLDRYNPTSVAINKLIKVISKPFVIGQ